MLRCWGRTRNLRRCGRKGNWKFFCDDHRLQPLVFLFVLVFTVVAGAASIQSAWFPQFGKPKSAGYRASFGTILLSQAGEEAGSIWLCADHGSGRVMTPVNFSTFITIENLSDHPTQVSSLSVDVRGENKPWVRLIRVDPLPKFTEVLCCTAHASGLNYLGTVALQSGGLLGRLWHGVLQPHVPVADVAFFEYPTAYDGPGARFEVKLNLRDNDGTTFSVVEARPIDPATQADAPVQGDKLTVLAPYKDYSSLPIVRSN